MPFKDAILRVQAWERNLAGIGGDTDEDRNAEEIATVRRAERLEATHARVRRRGQSGRVATLLRLIGFQCRRNAMRSIVLAMVVAASGVVALAQDVIVAPRRSVVVSAQDHALVIANRGVLSHSRCNGYEGIGWGATPEQARRNCCYFGRRPIVEEGIAWSPVTRRWVAVIRYQ